VKGFVFAICVIVALALNVWAETRPHDQIMKDVNATYEKLKKSLDSRNASEAAQDAVKLQNLFKETEEFWKPFDTKDATDAAQGAQTAFAALSASVKVNNFQQALATYNSASQYCRACHANHRVQAADQSYRIKP
jgi:hypothetical protein